MSPILGRPTRAIRLWPRYGCPVRPISCSCGETEDLAGDRRGDSISVSCGRCGATWTRHLTHQCDKCGGADIQMVPLAIVEKGRGTQLSVVGTRPVYLCSGCDADDLRRYHDNRPNPLMPARLPTVTPDA